MRTPQRTFLAVASASAVVLAAAPLAQADGGRHVGARGTYVAPAEATNAYTYNPLVPVGARVKVDSWYRPDGRMVVVLRASGLEEDYEYGAHAHNNPCGATGGLAGPHYQFNVDPVLPSVNAAYANPDNEIWLDFTTDDKGRGWAMAVQDWQPPADRRPGSVILHIRHTAHGDGDGVPGSAGERLACLTVDF